MVICLTQQSLSPRPLSVGVMLAALVALNLLAFASSANAQRGASYLPPFPKGDSYNLLVIGDDFSYGMRQGLTRALTGTARVKILPRPLHFQGLLRTNTDRLLKRIETTLKESKIAIVVMMVGARDAVAIRNQKGKRFRVGTDVWRKEYARRVDALMALFKRNSVAVYWAGLPVTSRPKRNESYRVMNDILRDRAFRAGLKFINVFSEFGDAQERFAAYGPDLQGETRLLRSRDGIFFTDAGNRKLVHFVMRKLRRDLKQARQDRQIPLAGSETEQARIRITRTGSTPNNDAGASEIAEERTTAAPRGTNAPGLVGEQPAEHGRIALRVRQSSGVQKAIELDILRPRIPASVIALITRRTAPNKRAEIGETLIDNIPNGLTVMSSITPSSTSASGRRKALSPTQTPFFRVMVKGEALPPVAGRVDDFSWQGQIGPSN